MTFAKIHPHLRSSVAALAILGLSTCSSSSPRDATNKSEHTDTFHDQAFSATTTSPMPTIRAYDVAYYPLPGLLQPTEFQFSPDDQWLTYLRSTDRTLDHQLFVFDPLTGKEQSLATPPAGGVQENTLSREEQLQRERQRVRSLGITHYEWAKQKNRLVIPLTGNVYIQEGLGAPLQLLVSGEEAPALMPNLSPNGRFLAFVQNRQLYVLDIDRPHAKPQRISPEAKSPEISYGLAEYIAQEEMDRKHGFWWSPDSSWIAFTEVDESPIPIFRTNHQDEHHYPFTGQANARVRLAVAAVPNGTLQWVELDPLKEGYLARVKWFPNGSLSIQVENRQQDHLELIRFDPRSGKQELLVTEKSPVWINLHHILHPLKYTTKEDAELSGGFVWASERSGFLHLYLYDHKGQLIRPLTSGTWPVDQLHGVDEAKRMVYFSSGKDDPRERHLYSVSLDGAPDDNSKVDTPRRITQAPGVHQVVIDHQFQRFVDSFSNPSMPPEVGLYDLATGKKLHTIPSESDPRVKELSLPQPEFVELTNRHGDRLYGAIYRPPSGSGPFPTLVAVYGGPHVQRVTREWALTVDMRAQWLASQGYLVFKLDNRGSARRGLEFEGVIRHDLGHLEVEDQVDGVRWLVEQKLCDPNRVGIYGWSYGGYLSAMALARAPEVFKLAIAGAPVTHWDGYDTHYTERYMGTPASNPTGYQTSSVMHHVKNIRGHLLLIHGLIDENVHFRHTARLINALTQANIAYDLLLFPDERHMPRKLEDRVYMEERLLDFIKKHL